jgi:hypothetical protein
VREGRLPLSIRIPEGLAVIVDAHIPALEKFLEAAAAIDPQIYMVIGPLSSRYETAGGSSAHCGDPGLPPRRLFS